MEQAVINRMKEVLEQEQRRKALNRERVYRWRRANEEAWRAKQQQYNKKYYAKSVELKAKN